MAKYNTIEELELKHQQQIEQIEKKHLETIHRLIGNYERQLKEKQAQLEKTLNDSETLYHTVMQREVEALKNSWTWRIGFFQTSAIRLVINFFRNPVKFATSSRYRWNNIYFYGREEVKESPKAEVPVLVESVKVTKPEDCEVRTDPSKLTFVCVLDTFTKTCFEPEFNIVSPSPHNWKKVLEGHRIDGIFVESAWHGNDNTWESLTSNYSGAKNLDFMKDLLGTAGRMKIPSFFWNKEDPVHYSRFIETARLFDHVFTSDGEILDKYREALGHDRVYALPFAAQHKIHNPVRETPRDKTVSFAGTYYNFSFAERKLDMDVLLLPSMDFGLEIFDRNYGATGLAAEQFGFPAVYKKAVKGKLEYSDMLKAYKDYKVYLNVNSVKYSSTMFARRVFELLACGTPVISNYSKGIISLLGEGTVFISESEADTRSYLEKLIGDQHYWWRHSLNGMRIVLEKHTYQDRTEDIFALTGHPFKRPLSPSFLVCSKVSNIGDVHHIIKMAEGQNFKPTGIIFSGVEGLPAETLQAIREMDGKPFRLNFQPDGQMSSAGELGKVFDFSHYAIFGTNHYYGPNYLRDYALAVKYADAEIMGKAESVAVTENGVKSIPAGNKEFRWCQSVPSSTIVISKVHAKAENLQELLTGGHFTSAATHVFSLDPFNFVADARALSSGNAKMLEEFAGI